MARLRRTHGPKPQPRACRRRSRAGGARRAVHAAELEESTIGLLGGSLQVDHTVTVDLASSLGREVKVKVLERVPVTDDKDVEVKLLHARPEAEPYTQAERGALAEELLAKKKAETPPPKPAPAAPPKRKLELLAVADMIFKIGWQEK